MNVLITGAARGIGAESARRLAAQGHTVALVGLEPEELERVAAQCGGSSFAIEADITDAAGIARAVDDAAARLGGLDAVVANAGIATAGLLRHLEPARFAQQVEVNLIGTFNTVRAALPHLVERRGYLLLVASAASLVHGPVLGAYTATKAATEALGDSLRVEVKHLGVDVGVAYFSWIATEMVTGAFATPTYQRLRDSLRGPFGRTYPVEAAADAVVKGIDKRRRIVVAPGWLRAFHPLRGLVQRPQERDVLAIMPELEELEAADRAQRGEAASAPVGSGGAAAEATRAPAA